MAEKEAATEAEDDFLIPCDDFYFFEAKLNTLRKDDDLISLELNKIDVSSQADCGRIWTKLIAGTKTLCLPARPIHRCPLSSSGYELREKSIQRCLGVSASKLAALKAEQKANPGDTDLELEILREKDKLSNIKCTSVPACPLCFFVSGDQPVLLVFGFYTAELTVEQIVKNRSLMLFKDKCHSFQEARSYRSPTRAVPKEVVGPSAVRR